MTAELLQKAEPGSEEYERLRLRAIAGDAAAASDYAHACLWNAIKKDGRLSMRKKNLLFRKIVNGNFVQVTLG